MQIIDLFSGIGGFSLAGHWCGWHTVQFVEMNDFCKRYLRYHYPDTPIHNDIKTFNYEQLKKSKWKPDAATIICGGFPCQPYSSAGKRQGKADDRHLWPEMLRVIQEVQSDYVVAENVRGLISWNEGVVFDEVQSDLEAAGYQVAPFLLPAAGVNAPHQRYRVWFIGYFEKFRRERARGSRNRGARFEDANSGVAPNPNAIRLAEQGRSTWMGRIRSYKHNTQANKTNWSDFPTQPPVCGGNDGIPDQLDSITISKWRKEALKALGNSIVPQVAYQIFQAIIQTDKQLNK